MRRRAFIKATAPSKETGKDFGKKSYENEKNLDGLNCRTDRNEEGISDWTNEPRMVPECRPKAPRAVPDAGFKD